QASATNASGCLTLQFVSSPSGNTIGFAANIFCGNPCQDITPSIDSTIPEAVDGIVTILPGESVDFFGSATFSEDGTGAEYEWDLDFGPDLAGQNVTGTFNNSGTYTVTLTVTDANPFSDCSATTTITVIVLSEFIDVDPDVY